VATDPARGAERRASACRLEGREGGQRGSSAAAARSELVTGELATEEGNPRAARGSPALDCTGRQAMKLISPQFTPILSGSPCHQINT
jgi:hypothetical protein